LKLIPVIILLFCISASGIAQKSLNLRADLTPELVNVYDAYIKKYAPADSAFNVVIAMANKHFSAKRAAVSSYLYSLYKPYFPDRELILDNEIRKLEQIMISQSATHDMFPLYIGYINKNAPSDDAFFALQRISDMYIRRQDWDSAAIVYQTFAKKFPQKNEQFNKIIKIITAKSEGLEITNLGQNVNSPGSEWDPTPTPDGRFLYFTADHRKNGKGLSDIWVSENIGGEWQKAENIGKPINSGLDETVDNVSADGNGLLISGNFSGSYGEFDIYLAEKDSSAWKDIIHFSSPINSKYHDESGCITADGKALLLTSDRPGGIGPFIPINKQFYGGTIMGNMDIYVCVETDSGWGNPINLGSTINTPYSERAAYLHPDGKNLYFSSNGHYGLGKLDVYKSVRLSDTSWTEWSEPVNLGKEINTANDDWGYVVDINGEIAYFAKEGDYNSYGNWDLYSITLPDIAKPQAVAIIKGKVTDSLGRPIECNIVWEDLETGKQVGHLKSDPRDGYYFISLPLGKNYGYYANRIGFYPTSNNIDLKNIKNNITIQKDIVLVSVKDMQQKGAKVRINNIFFDLDKSVLKDESIPELNRLLIFIDKLKSFKIVIEGHTDDTGNKSHNQKLSEERAKSVANFLINKGVDPKRIITEGYGDSRPALPNNSEENKALNRRVEIRLQK
jgi:outer membrane protein OmpA-like peptidoglycan-associated protein